MKTKNAPSTNYVRPAINVLAVMSLIVAGGFLSGLLTYAALKHFFPIGTTAAAVALSISLLATLLLTILLFGIRLEKKALRRRLTAVQLNEKETIISMTIKLHSTVAKDNAVREIYYRYGFWVALFGMLVTSALIIITIWQAATVGTGESKETLAIISALSAISAVISGVFLKMYSKTSSELKIGRQNAERLYLILGGLKFFREEIAKLTDAASRERVREDAIRSVLSLSLEQPPTQSAKE